MNLLSISISDIIFIVFYILGIYVLAQKAQQLYGKKFYNLFLLISVVQFLMTIYYTINSFYNPSDCRAYYAWASAMSFSNISWDQSVSFINNITFILINLFKLHYIGCMFFCSFIGLLGWFYLLKIVIHITKGIWHKWYYILAMLQMHFWTCALGKDSLIFWGICMVVYCWYFHKNILYYILPCFFIGFIRSPILVLIGGAYAVSFLLKSKANIFIKVVVCIVIFVGAIAFMPIVEQRLGIEEGLSIESLDGYISRVETYNQEGGSSVDMSNANIIVKIFSYIFRPLFFDARSILQLEASFENLVWLLIFIFIVKNFKRKYLLWFPTLAFALLWLAQGSTLTNLGIAMRQKMMFFPFFIILFFQVVYDVKLQKIFVYKMKMKKHKMKIIKNSIAVNSKTLCNKN